MSPQNAGHHRPLSGHLNPQGQAKRKFATEADAQTFADVEQQRNGSNRRPYGAYQCDHCGSWHVGRRPVPESERKRMRDRARAKRRQR